MYAWPTPASMATSGRELPPGTVHVSADYMMWHAQMAQHAQMVQMAQHARHMHPAMAAAMAVAQQARHAQASVQASAEPRRQAPRDFAGRAWDAAGRAADRDTAAARPPWFYG